MDKRLDEKLEEQAIEQIGMKKFYEMEYKYRELFKTDLMTNEIMFESYQRDDKDMQRMNRLIDRISDLEIERWLLDNRAEVKKLKTELKFFEENQEKLIEVIKKLKIKLKFFEENQEFQSELIKKESVRKLLKKLL